MLKTSNDTYDIAIVGAGIMGLSCALDLAQQSALRIVILDAKAAPKAWQADKPDLRVSAITQVSRQFFQRLNAWSDMAAMRISAFEKMFVWDENSDGNIGFDCAEVGTDYLGFIIENQVIQQALLQQLAQYPQVEIRYEQPLKQLYITDEQALLTLNHDERLTARLLIGADGAQSWVREQMDIGLRSWSYDQHAVVCQIKSHLTHEKTAWQRFLQQGPLAFLPLSDPHQSSIVWSTSPQDAQRLCEMPVSEFESRLAMAFADRLGTVELETQRVSFPLVMRHAREYVKPRMALIGDACHTIHPLAGQGANLGLLDAASLVNVILDADKQGRDYGDYKILRRYERQRKTDNVAMIAAMEAFKRLFSNDQPLLTWLRGTGLRMTNKAGHVKQHIMSRAMGFR